MYSTCTCTAYTLHVLMLHVHVYCTYTTCTSTCTRTMNYGWAIIQYVAYIAIMVLHDFGLAILSQWQNIVLLQLNNSSNILHIISKQESEVSSSKN